MKKNDKNPSKEYTLNYQKAINNYANAIKFYTNHFQILEGIKKIIDEYKESIKLFTKKLVNIQKNLIKPLYEEKQKIFNFSFYIKYLLFLDNFLNFQVESMTNTINELDQKVFPENEKNNFNNNLAIFNSNKNNLQNSQINMEKLFIDYNLKHKKFMNEFFSIEEDVQKYYYNIRKKKTKDPGLKNFNKIVTEANNAQYTFMESHNKFQENNKNFFYFYNTKMKELINELIQKENYTEDNMNSFISIFTNNINSLINISNNYFTEEKQLINKEKNNDINIFKEKHILKINSNYEKEKYKVKAIHKKIVEDYLTQESKELLNALNDEFDIIDDFEEISTIVLNEDDVFAVAKFFYGLFAYVDTSEYNLIIEKKKLEVRDLTNKLLQFGLIKKDFKEYKDLLPISDTEVESLKEYFKKDREYILSFLQRINNYRILGLFDMPEREYELTGNFFILILDCILKEKTEKDYFVIKFMMILSQTFYVNKNEEKVYLINKLKGHKLFFDLDFLKKCLNLSLKDELEKSLKQSQNKLSDKHKDEMIFATVLPFANYFKEIGLNKEQLLQIIEGISDEYKLNEENMNNIKAIIEI